MNRARRPSSPSLWLCLLRLGGAIPALTLLNAGASAQQPAQPYPPAVASPPPQYSTVPSAPPAQYPPVPGTTPPQYAPAPAVNPAQYSPAPAAPPGLAAPGARPPAAPVDPLELPLQYAAEAARTFRGVKDYTCTFVKHEQVGGKLLPETIMEMKVRQQPFSVYLRFLGPKDLAGQEVCYVTGGNEGALRVHATGLLRGAVGFVSLAPTDPRVTSQSRHPITEAGIGNLIESLRQNWTAERGMGQTQIKTGDFEYARRKCTRFETIHAANGAGRTYAYRTLVYFDKESHLPIRFEAYDWPHFGGPAGGTLLESYSYFNLHFNVGLGDETFKH